jgi:hypothetical protein
MMTNTQRARRIAIAALVSVLITVAVVFAYYILTTEGSGEAKAPVGSAGTETYKVLVSLPEI